MLNRILKQPSR